MCLTERSAKRITRKALARTAHAMLKASATSSKRELGRFSVVTLFSVRIYQWPIKLGIDNMIEKGIIIPENIGNSRLVLTVSGELESLNSSPSVAGGIFRPASASVERVAFRVPCGCRLRWKWDRCK